MWPSPSPKKSMDASTEPSGARILIVDDQPWNVRLLEHTLRRGGFSEISSTDDSRSVAPRHLQHRFDLIVLDLQMPGLNGFEVMKELRAIEGDRVPILVMSADPSRKTAALEGGGTSFLSKPFVLAEVLTRVGEMLRGPAAADLEKSEQAKPGDRE